MRPEHTLLLLALCAGCRAELASELDERQADEVLLALDEAAIGAQKERATAGGFRVLVAREDVAAALAVLRDRELPRERTPGFAELFAERGLVPSASDERARQSAATSGELARSIESFPGVTRARVHLALPDPGARSLAAGPARPRASVLVEHRASARVDEGALRALVAGAVPELRAEDVAVVRTEARRPTEAREPRLVTIGPISVTRASAGSLKAILAASLGLNVALAAALLLVRARRRRSSGAAPPAAAIQDSDGG